MVSCRLYWGRAPRGHIANLELPVALPSSNCVYRKLKIRDVTPAADVLPTEMGRRQRPASMQHSAHPAHNVAAAGPSCGSPPRTRKKRRGPVVLWPNPAFTRKAVSPFVRLLLLGDEAHSTLPASPAPPFCLSGQDTGSSSVKSPRVCGRGAGSATTSPYRAYRCRAMILLRCVPRMPTVG